MFEYFILKDIIKKALVIEKDYSKRKKAITKIRYLSFFYDYMNDYNIKVKEELLELLITTKFHKEMGIKELNLQEIIDNLPFNRDILFNYEYGIIEIL